MWGLWDALACGCAFFLLASMEEEGPDKGKNVEISSDRSRKGKGGPGKKSKPSSSPSRPSPSGGTRPAKRVTILTPDAGSKSESVKRKTNAKSGKADAKVVKVSNPVAPARAATAVAGPSALTVSAPSAPPASSVSESGVVVSVGIDDNNVSLHVPAELLPQIDIIHVEGEALSVIPLLSGAFLLRMDVKAVFEDRLPFDDCVSHAAAGLGLSEEVVGPLLESLLLTWSSSSSSLEINSVPEGRSLLGIRGDNVSSLPGEHAMMKAPRRAPDCASQTTAFRFHT